MVLGTTKIAENRPVTPVTFHFTCSTSTIPPTLCLVHTLWTFSPRAVLDSTQPDWNRTAHEFCTSTPDSRSKRTESGGSRIAGWKAAAAVVVVVSGAARASSSAPSASRRRQGTNKVLFLRLSPWPSANYPTRATSLPGFGLGCNVVDCSGELEHAASSRDIQQEAAKTESERRRELGKLDFGERAERYPCVLSAAPTPPPSLGMITEIVVRFGFLPCSRKGRQLVWWE